MIKKEMSSMVSPCVEAPRRSARPFSIAARLAWVHVSRSWLLFLLTGTGMLVSAILLCTLPLFTTVATSADLRNMFGATTDGYAFGPQVTINKLSPAFVQQASQITAHVVAQGQVPYNPTLQQLCIQTPALDIYTTPINTEQAGSSDEQMVLNGYAMQQAQAHVTLVQGQLPGVESQAQDMQIAVFWRSLHCSSALFLPYRLSDSLRSACCPPSIKARSTCWLATRFRLHGMKAGLPSVLRCVRLRSWSLLCTVHPASIS